MSSGECQISKATDSVSGEKAANIQLISNKTEMAEFMRSLASADVLYVTINSLAKGTTAVSFNVAGASPAIELVRRVCHS